MEDLILCLDELKLLLKFKDQLESRFKIKITLPFVNKKDYSTTDVFCANLSGTGENINYIKNFVKRKKKELDLKRKASCSVLNDVPLITLSDSDSDTSVLVETQNKSRRKKRRICLSKISELPVVDLASPAHEKNENVCEVTSTVCDLGISETNKQTETDCATEINFSSDVETITLDDTFQEHQHSKAIDYIPLRCEKNDSPKENRSKDSNKKSGDDSVIILSDEVPRPVSNIILSDEVPRPVSNIILSDEVPRPVSNVRRLLRPVVIDGSNVARLHGQTTNTFSSKGIQISVEYFLNRGHTQVTAFVPNFRRHCKNGRVMTTDESILEELALKQHVVFTPSRNLNGKRLTCYDDRFIVELATKTKGVILSNDNYKDLMSCSAGFKKTIEERLLMFCFVGDILMIPDDPLGMRGPKLDEFLSMPENVSNASSPSIPTKSSRVVKFMK